MTKTVYGPSEIVAWLDALEDKRPATISEVEWPGLPQIESFAAGTLNAAMTFRLRDRAGGEFAFVINPIAARHMVACILKQGMEAGWLNDKAEVVCPPAPELDS